MTVLSSNASRRTRSVDPTNPRSAAARSRNRDPCTECKKARQKCTFSLSGTCQRCNDKNLLCERVAPRRASFQMFIIEDGRRPIRQRPRSNTLSSLEFSIASTLSEADIDAETDVLSPTSPIRSGIGSGEFNHPESPTTELGNRFGSFTFDDGSSKENTGTFVAIASEGDATDRQCIGTLDKQVSRKGDASELSPESGRSAPTETIASQDLSLSLNVDQSGSGAVSVEQLSLHNDGNSVSLSSLVCHPVTGTEFATDAAHRGGENGGINDQSAFEVAETLGSLIDVPSYNGLYPSPSFAPLPRDTFEDNARGDPALWGDFYFWWHLNVPSFLGD